MELRHLRYFAAVADELNFTRAAERLHMAQPPLSTQIKALESELGVALFERDRRRVHLTPAGRRFRVRVQEILAAVQSARGELQDGGAGAAGQLTLGFTPSSVLLPRVPPALARFRAGHPAVELKMTELTSTDQVDALHARVLDLGMLRKPNVSVPLGIEIEAWHASPLLVAMPAGHALAHRRGVDVRDLDGVPLIVYPKDAGIGLYWKVQELCSRAGFRPAVAHEARDASTIVGLVAAGIGVAIVTAETRCIQLPGVHHAPLLGEDATSTLYLGYRRADASPHLSALLQALRRSKAARTA